jgi:hypothetical protein
MPKSPDPATKTIEAIREGLPPGVELDEREDALLDLARRQARDVAAAEADIESRGYLVTGSRGQDVINPSVAEVRQSRIALGKLLGQLDLPESTRDAVRNARTAAEARWSKAS